VIHRVQLYLLFFISTKRQCVWRLRYENSATNSGCFWVALIVQAARLWSTPRHWLDRLIRKRARSRNGPQAHHHTLEYWVEGLDRVKCCSSSQ